MIILIKLTNNNDQEGTFANAKENSLWRGRYSNLLSGLKNRGFLRYERELPKKPKVWSVNEAILPPGTVNYTGVRHTTPLAKEEKPKPPVIIEPKEETCRAFWESELKSIKVQECILGNGDFNFTADIKLHDISLWDIYKLGLAMEQTVETRFGKECVVPGLIKETISKEDNGKEESTEQQSDERVSDEDINTTNETEEGAAF